MAVFILRTYYPSGRTWANIFEIRLERRTTKGSSSGCIMRLVLVFILETHNQKNVTKCYKMFAQVRPDG